jgi:predicted TIM-barrel fold metal-dependent hydrolase
MARAAVTVVDADGHLMESIPELAQYMDPDLRREALQPYRNRQGVFPSLDGIHYLRMVEGDEVKERERITASAERTGSGEDWAAFLDKAEVEHTVLFTTEGLSVGLIQHTEYAVRLCRAYNDYVADRYRRVDPRLHPMALVPMQDVQAAVSELRRAVRELALPGAMIPSSGLALPAGHDYYWPLYAEAAELGCALAFHGGSNRGIGLDPISDFNASHILHHPVPLMYALTTLVCYGVLDRYPDLRVGFMEGGCGWLVPLLDRMKRNEEYFDTRATKRGLPEYIHRGQILIGCEGEDESMPYVVQRAGAEAFAYSSDYPHEVDLVDARRQIEETMERTDLTPSDKAAILGGNARRFFGLP